MTLAQLNIAQKQADEDLVALITKLEGMEPKVLKKRLKLLGLPKLTKLESKVSTSHSESDITATSRQQFGLCPICRLVHPLTSAASMLQAPMGIKKKVFVLVKKRTCLLSNKSNGPGTCGHESPPVPVL